MRELSMSARWIQEALEAYREKSGVETTHLPEEESPDHVFHFEVDACTTDLSPVVRFVHLVGEKYQEHETVLWFAYSVYNEISWRDWLNSLGHQKDIKAITFRLDGSTVRDLTIENYSGKTVTYAQPNLYRVLYAHRFPLNIHSSPPP